MDRYISTSKTLTQRGWLVVATTILLLTTSCVNGLADGHGFEYRGVYAPSAKDVGADWGLWGHNLRKLFDGQVPPAVRAQGDPADVEQFCFSSPVLFKALENYVVDNYGEGDDTTRVRFVVMPDDNSKVCLCTDCMKAGNKAGDASPAVCRLLSRLAHRFPHYQFFTSAYRSTKEPPREKLPANTGVIVSAIDLPMRDMQYVESQTATLASLIDRWREVTDHLFVWDYVRNFDDYLTPYPCLRLLQQRLLFYQSIGVSGVFLNGSGYDYASFEDMQTEAEKALLAHPSLNLDKFITDYFNKWYPISSRCLADYYLSLEKAAVNGGKVLPFYGGIDDAVSAGLSVDSFTEFMTRLDRMSKAIKGDERIRLNRLLTGLQFTQLELLRRTTSMYDGNLTADPLESLRGYKWFAYMSHYREDGALLDHYIQEWDNVKHYAYIRDGKQRDLQLGGDYGDLHKLTDGIVGFASDYHTAWLIFDEPTVRLSFPIQTLAPGDELQVSLLQAPSWHIGLPISVELWQNGNLLARATPTSVSDRKRCRSLVTLKVEKPDTEVAIELRLVGRNGWKVACDEIVVLPTEKKGSSL